MQRSQTRKAAEMQLETRQQASEVEASSQEVSSRPSQEQGNNDLEHGEETLSSTILLSRSRKHIFGNSTKILQIRTEPQLQEVF